MEAVESKNAHRDKRVPDRKAPAAQGHKKIKPVMTGTQWQNEEKGRGSRTKDDRDLQECRQERTAMPQNGPDPQPTWVKLQVDFHKPGIVPPFPALRRAP